jgi:hypothetical protein
MRPVNVNAIVFTVMGNDYGVLAKAFSDIYLFVDLLCSGIVYYNRTLFLAVGSASGFIG